jgi:hypothetical protein
MAGLFSPTHSRHGYKSPTRELAYLVDRKYGEVVMCQIY